MPQLTHLGRPAVAIIFALLSTAVACNGTIGLTRISPTPPSTVKVTTEAPITKPPALGPTLVFTEIVWPFERIGNHNVIDSGNGSFEKFAVSEEVPGVYISMNLATLGDFLKLDDTNMFFAETAAQTWQGEWKIEGENVVLTPPN